ncbi:peptidase [Protofrankia coriariae]|uniref:Peptidase n=1 Tax=Protofrankia coriariae TaxID=1562887 RepID=A0ABR5F3T7_9ACTN|nr:peptidase [Protofrankia coriariae]KLL11381.1 peptidase [Protofrankia coriariae]
MRRVLTTLAVLVAGMLIPATSALTAPARAADSQPGSIGIRLLDAPTNERDNPRARIYIVDYLPLGAVIHRHIEVTNKSGSEARLTVYPGAASVENGTFNIAAGRTPNDLTTWISLDPGTLVLPPGASAPVTATITVPRDASPGERYAGIWAETTAPASQDKGVVEVNRVGIRVYLAVGPGGPPAPNFTIDSLTPKRLSDGRPALTAQVHNTGGRALDMSGELTLTEGPGGLNTRPFPAKLGTTLAPGQTEPVTVVLDSQLPDGPWKARIHLKSGLTEQSAQATVTFPRRPGAAVPVKTTSTASRNYLIGAIDIAVLLLAPLGFTILRRNRRASRTRTIAES